MNLVEPSELAAAMSLPRWFVDTSSESGVAVAVDRNSVAVAQHLLSGSGTNVLLRKESERNTRSVRVVTMLFKCSANSRQWATQGHPTFGPP